MVTDAGEVVLVYLKDSSEVENSKCVMSDSAKSTGVQKHPAYGDMVERAIVSLHGLKGSSRAAILKFITEKFQVGSNLKMINAHLRLALKRGVEKGTLKQMKGVGAAGSFRLSSSKSKKKRKKGMEKIKPTKVGVQKTEAIVSEDQREKESVDEEAVAVKPETSSVKKPSKARKWTGVVMLKKVASRK